MALCISILPPLSPSFIPQVRTLIRQQFDTALSSYDALITPTAPTAAYVKGATLLASALLIPWHLPPFPLPSSLSSFPSFHTPCFIILLVDSFPYKASPSWLFSLVRELR